MHDLIQWKQDNTGKPYNIFTVELQDSKNKRYRDQDFLRLEITVTDNCPTLFAISYNVLSQPL